MQNSRLVLFRLCWGEGGDVAIAMLDILTTVDQVNKSCEECICVLHPILLKSNNA